ncbi:MAG: adenosine deaminase, partial [Erysipelotrichaceae bacterium]|nr:adenosine deaminase [Erysipelotrichaceae bacterium]
AKNLLEMGVAVTINTDNMTMARVTLDDEYDHCLNEMGFEYNDLIRMNINSVRASFMKKEKKDALIKELESYLI